MSMESLNENAKAAGQVCFVATLDNGKFGLFDVDKAKPAEVYDDLREAIADRDFYNSPEGTVTEDETED